MTFPAGAKPVVLYDGSGNPLAVQDGVAIPANTSAILAAGSDGTNARNIATTNNGTLVNASIAVAIQQGRFAGVAGTCRGNVTTNAVAEAAIRATAYTEQSSNAQRSVNSNNAADTSAGTGARTVRLTYYAFSASTITGPFTEDVTLNGTSAVNTVATNICFIESIEVLTAGSGGVNAGIIQLFAATAGGGGVIASIAATARRTNYGHHYVADGRTAYCLAAFTSSTAASGQRPEFYARYLDFSIANAAERFTIDDLKQQGAVSSNQTRFLVPRIVPSNSRLLLYVLPSNGTSQVNSMAVDFVEY